MKVYPNLISLLRNTLTYNNIKFAGYLGLVAVDFMLIFIILSIKG